MKTVLLFGTFDIVHPGHVSLFRQARRYGDRLIVVVARDTTVKKVKGRAPLYAEKDRRAFLQHIRLVDQVILGDSKDVYAAVKRIRPEVICLGYDQKAFVGPLKQEIAAFSRAPRIVRLKAYAPGRYKTWRIRRHLDL